MYYIFDKGSRLQKGGSSKSYPMEYGFSFVENFQRCYKNFLNKCWEILIII